MTAFPSARALGYGTTRTMPEAFPPLRPSKEDAPADNVVGEITAFKVFGFDRQGILWSPYVKNARWTPNESHFASEPGFFSWKSIKDAIGRETMGDVIARVSIWGDVLEGEWGYRSSHCRIEGVLAVHPAVQERADWLENYTERNRRFDLARHRYNKHSQDGGENDPS